MRNLKKYLSVLLAVAMILTAMAPAFAAGFTYEAQGQALKDLGIIEGVSPTDLGLGLALNREQGVKLVLGLVGKLKAAEALTDADVTTAFASYTDAATVSDWAKKYVAYAVKNGIVNGVDATTLAPQVNLSGKMLATLILRNLGYTVNDNDYANAAGILAEKGGLTATQALAFNNKDLIRDDMAAIAFGALKVKDAAGKTVIENLVAAGVVTEAKAVAAGLMTATPTPAPDAFAITDVKAESLVRVVVTFNYAIDEDSIETGDFEVDGVASINKDDVDLSDDGKTATIKLDPDTQILDNGEDYDVIVTNITDTEGNEIDEVSAEFTVSDDTVPTVTKIEFTGPETAKIYFSEPVDEELSVDATVEIDGGSYSASPATGFDGKTEVTVNIGTELDEGDHVFKVKDFSDFVPHNNAVKNVTVKYASIETAPTVKIIEATQAYVVLEFNRPVKEVNDVDSYYQTYASWKPLEVQDEDDNDITDSAYNSTYYDTVKLVFTGAEMQVPQNSDNDLPLPEGKVKIVVLNESDDSDEDAIEDRWENELDGDVTLYAQVAADAVAPTVSKVTVEDEDEIRVYFSEEVVHAAGKGALDEDNYVIKNSDGDVIKDSDWVITGYNTDDDYATIKFDENLDEGTYTVTVEAVEDTSVAGNTVDTVTKEFTVSDVSEVDWSGVSATWNDEDKYLLVKYDEEMATSGAGSVLDADNYRVDGDELDDLSNDDYNFKLSMLSSKIVKIAFTGTVAFDLETSTLTIGRVADKAGNVAKALSTDKVIGTETAPTVTDIKKVDENKFEITIDQEIKSIGTHAIYVDAYNLDGVSTNVYATVKPPVNDDGEATITIIVPDSQKSAGTEAPVNYTIVVAADKIKTFEGAAVAYTEYTAITDGAAPEVAEIDLDGAGNDYDDEVAVYAYDDNGNTAVDHILIKYSEAISAGSLSKYTYEVDGHEVTAAKVVADLGHDLTYADLHTLSVAAGAAQGEWVVLTIKYDSDNDGDNEDDITVTQLENITDDDDNELTAEDGGSEDAMSSVDVVEALNP